MEGSGAVTMFVVLQFAFATLLPVVFAVLFTYLERNTRFSGLAYWKKQLIIGLVFGGIAIFGTEVGINTNGATMNVRDAAPLVAGLYLGGPAGIIAGIIGGVERWFAVYWGAGMFTRLACTVATIAVGFYAALLRWYLFEDHKPKWPIALVIGAVAEVLHLLLVFVTNMDDTLRAFQVAQECTWPSVGCNALSVALSGIAITLASGQKLQPQGKGLENISQKVQAGMLAVVLVGFVATTGFMYLLQGGIATGDAENTLFETLQDVDKDIHDASDSNLLALARRAGQMIPSKDAVNPEVIADVMKSLNLAEINIVNVEGIITASSEENFVGFDMASGAQSAEFLALLPTGTTNEYVQDYMPMTWDSTVWRKYAGVRIAGGFLQVAYDASRFANDLRDKVSASVANRHVGHEGMLVVLSSDGAIVGARADADIVRTDADVLLAAIEGVEEGETFNATLHDVSYLAMYRITEGFKVIALLPSSEVVMSRNLVALVTSFMEVIIFAALFAAIYLLIKRIVVRSIWQVNGRLGQITKGDLAVKVDVRDSTEFASLSDDINATVAALREAIAAESRRIETDLATAKAIQESALPRTFPPFPEIKAFDIYASMNAAREVGGDFYDFFLVDDHTLGFLIADVSGKGIPASLFMMTAKAELANFINSGMELSEAMQSANRNLCHGNDAGMFVTVWAATLDFETGKLTYVNAGHNFPMLFHAGEWTQLDKRCGLFLGTFDTAKYRQETIMLDPGDELLLYTDGVTEAFSPSEELYGEERLASFLAAHDTLSPHMLIDALHVELRHWADGAEQSDDITMLCVQYGVPPEISGSVVVKATTEGLGELIERVHFELSQLKCPVRVQNKIDHTIEELFVNVCEYGYSDHDEPGAVRLAYVCDHDSRGITISLVDSGVPFDPTQFTTPVSDGIRDDFMAMGIVIAMNHAEDVSYIRDGENNVVAFRATW